MSRDLELLERLRRQEQQGLEQAIRQYAGYVSAVIRKTLGLFGTREDIEELTSDVFVALWQKAEALRDDSNLKYWLGVVARNAALKQLNRVRLEEPFEEDLLPPEGENPGAGPESLIELEEQRQQVRLAVDGMDPPDREIFLRYYFWYQRVSQIAREMELNESTVKTRLRRGREKLRETLAKEEQAV